MRIAFSAFAVTLILALPACNSDDAVSQGPEDKSGNDLHNQQASNSKHGAKDGTTPQGQTHNGRPGQDEKASHQTKTGHSVSEPHGGRQKTHGGHSPHVAPQTQHAKPSSDGHEEHDKHRATPKSHENSNHARHGHSQRAGHEKNARRGDAHHGRAHSAKPIKIGDQVPEFEVSIGGKKWKLSEIRKNGAWSKDGVLMLTFWCSFCHSCRDVEKELDEVAQRFKGKAGVIALDASAGETTEEVSAFAKKRGLTLPIALNSSGNAADLFGTRVTTTTVVIDSKGLLRYRGRFASRSHSYAEDALKNVLAGKKVAVAETKHRG